MSHYVRGVGHVAGQLETYYISDRKLASTKLPLTQIFLQVGVIMVLRCKSQDQCLCVAIVDEEIEEACIYAAVFLLCFIVI